MWLAEDIKTLSVGQISCCLHMSRLATAQTHNIYGNKDANLGQLKDQRLKNSTYEDSLQQESLLALTQHGWCCDFLFTNCNNCMHLREVPAMLVIRPVGHALTSCPFLLLCNMQTFVCRFCCPSTCQNSMDSTHQHNRKILIDKVMYIQSGLNVVKKRKSSQMMFNSLAMVGSETVGSLVGTTKDTIIVLLLDRSVHIVRSKTTLLPSTQQK